MPRALVPLVFAVAMLTACAASPPPAPVVEQPNPDSIAFSALQQWLGLQQAVAKMDAEMVVSELVLVGKPDGVEELFYFGLLNQKLQTYSSWVQARDSFRQLQQDESLTVERRQLAAILQEYDQSRINWYQRHVELHDQHARLEQQLHDAEQEKLLLEQKIQALTDLEAAISTRKEQ